MNVPPINPAASLAALAGPSGSSDSSLAGRNVSKIFVNAHSSAVGYYERLGFVHEDWQEPSGIRGSIAKDCVLMTK